MSNALRWPLVNNTIRKGLMNNTFGMVRKKADGSPKPHQGWDLAAPVGTASYAVADGKVEWTKNQGDYGLQMCMSFKFDGTTYYAFYAHMKSLSVKDGDPVTLGKPIGQTGKSGNAQNLDPSEDHLHFEIRTQPSAGFGLGGRVSPMKLYGVCPLHNTVVSPLAAGA